MRKYYNNKGQTFASRMDWYLDPKNKYIKINKKTGCWIWQRCRLPAGYGLVSSVLIARAVGTKNNSLVHRAAYLHAKGALSPSTHLDHLCGTASCCNPTHLEEVDASVNNARKALVRDQTQEIVELKNEIKRLNSRIQRLEKEKNDRSKRQPACREV